MRGHGRGLGVGVDGDLDVASVPLLASSGDFLHRCLHDASRVEVPENLVRDRFRSVSEPTSARIVDRDAAHPSCFTLFHELEPIPRSQPREIPLSSASGRADDLRVEFRAFPHISELKSINIIARSIAESVREYKKFPVDDVRSAVFGSFERMTGILIEHFS